MLADEKYDIKLNGSGFVLIEESYRRKAQQPFSPRFATGDPGYGDLSFWQFLAQTEWLSENQKIFLSPSRFKQSSGWDFSDTSRASLARNTSILAATFPSVLPNSLPGFEVIGEFATSINYVPPGWGFIQSPGAAVGTVDGELYVGSSNSSPNTSAAIRSFTGLVGTWVMLARFTSSNQQIYFFITPTAPNPNGSPSGSGYYISNVGGTVGVYRTGGVLLLSLLANPASTAEYRISRDSGGNFSVWVNGISYGGFTDNTHTTSQGMYVWNGNSDGSTVRLGFTYFTTDTSGGFYSPMPGASPLIYGNSIRLCYESAPSGSVGNVINVIDRNFVTGTPFVAHHDARHIAVINRGGISGLDFLGQYVGSVKNNSFKIRKNETEVVYENDQPGYDMSVIAPVNFNNIIVGATQGRNSGIPAFFRYTFNPDTWIASAVKQTRIDGGLFGSFVPSSAFDSSGALYFAISNTNQFDTQSPSRVLVISAADSVAADIRVTYDFYPENLLIRNVFSLGGTVYFAGALMEGSYYYSAIVKFPNTVVWRSNLGVPRISGASANNLNCGARAIYVSRDSAVFLGDNSIGSWTPLLKLELDGTVREVASFDGNALSSEANSNQFVIPYGGQYYHFQPSVAPTATRTNATRGALPATYPTMELELSDMGGNTQLIDKTLYSVLFRLTDPLPVGDTIDVYANGIFVGTINSASGTSGELVSPVEITSDKFSLRISAPRTNTWVGGIDDIAIKYVPTQFKKRAWAFGIRATKRLKLADGSREQQDPLSMFSQIEAAWASNVPVDFVDIDGTTHKVLVTDFDQRRPLIDRRGDQAAESFYFVELLEV